MTNIIWTVLSSKSGVDVNRLVMLVASADNIKTEVITAYVFVKLNLNWRFLVGSTIIHFVQTCKNDLDIFRAQNLLSAHQFKTTKWQRSIMHTGVCFKSLDL